MKHSDNDKHSFTVNLHNFEKQVIELSRQKPVLVDFWAEWCSPCRVLGPLLDKLSAEYKGDFSLAKLEVDEGDGENMKLAGHYRVRGFPTVIMFIDGEETARFSGAKPMAFLRQFVDGHRPA